LISAVSIGHNALSASVEPLRVMGVVPQPKQHCRSADCFCLITHRLPSSPPRRNRCGIFDDASPTDPLRRSRASYSGYRSSRRGSSWATTVTLHGRP